MEILAGVGDTGRVAWRYWQGLEILVGVTWRYW